MDAIVPPNNTSLLVEDSKPHHHRYNDDRGAWHLSDQLHATSNALHNNIDEAARHAAATAERVGFAGIDHTNQNGAEGRLVTNQNGADVRSSVERNGLEGRGNTDRNGLETRGLVREEGHETREDVERFGFHNSANTQRVGDRNEDHIERFGLYNAAATQRVGDKLDAEVDKFGLYNAKETRFYGHENFEALKDGFKDSLLQACHNTDKIICNENSNFRDVLLQAQNHTSAIRADLCRLELEGAKNTAAIQLEAAKNKCAIELDAHKNKEELARQMAECCCEVKELVRAKADGTDQLIRQMDAERLKDERDKYREELIALRVRATLPPPLVAAAPL